MYVGIFGDVIFSVGHLRTLTLSNFKGTSGAKWVDHEVIGGKAKSEYIAPKLMEYTCDILLDLFPTGEWSLAYHGGMSGAGTVFCGGKETDG